MKNRLFKILFTFALILPAGMAKAADNSWTKIDGELIPVSQVTGKNVVKNGSEINYAARNDDDRYYKAGALNVFAPRGAVFTIVRGKTVNLGNWTGFMRQEEENLDSRICRVYGNNSGKEINSGSDEMTFVSCPKNESVTVRMGSSDALMQDSYDAGYYRVRVKSQCGQESWLLRWATMSVNIHVARYKYAISFDSMGGSAVATQYNPGGWIDDTSYKLKANTTVTPTRPGYTFQGWYDQPYGGTLVSNNTEYDIKGDVEAVAAVTLYARWTPTPCTASFDPNGGAASFTSKDYDVEKNLTLPTASGVEGKYATWQVVSTAGNWIEGEEFPAGETVPAGRYGNVRFKAVWGNNKYLVKGYFDNGITAASVTNSVQTVEHGATMATMVFTPNPGYEITQVKVNGESVGGTFPKDSYSHSQTITSKTDIVAYASLKKFTFTASVDDASHATISGLSPQTVQYGYANKEVKFTASTGYMISDILVDGVSVGGKFPVQEYSFSQTMYSNLNVVAVTQIKTYTVTIDVDGLKDNDHAIVEVRTGGVLTHRIPVDATNPEARLCNIQEGSNLSVSLTGWTWMYDNPASQQKTVTSNTVFEFPVSAKSESRRHAETRKTHWNTND